MHVIHGSSRTTADNSHTWAQPPTATIAMAQPSTDTPAFRLERGAPYELTTCRCNVPFQSGQRVATCQGDEFAIEMCGNLVTIIPVQIGPEGLGAPFCSYRMASPRCPYYKLAEPNVHRGRFLLQNGSPS